MTARSTTAARAAVRLGRIEEDRTVIITSTGVFEDAHPQVQLFGPDPLVQIARWAVAPGGSLDEDFESETGLTQGYADADHDDSGWYSASRISEVSFGYPTWEGDGYRGYLWYRTRISMASAQDPVLVLGSPSDPRTLDWRVFVDGRLLTPKCIRGPVIRVPLPANAAGRDLAVAVQLASRRDWPMDRLREAEGWKRNESLCYQHVEFAASFTQMDFEVVDSHASGFRAVSKKHGLHVQVDFAENDPGITKSVTMLNIGADPVVVSSIRLARVRVQDAVSVHPEGAWAVHGPYFQAVEHPAGCTGWADGAIESVVWPGLRLEPSQEHQFPSVVLAGGDDPNGAHNVRAHLARVAGRPRQTLAIFDPYGWYQIAHTSEPKIELDEDMVAEIDSLLGRLSDAGVRFDMLALDTGWNDPDDLRRFHPTNFPSGSTTVTDVARRHGLGLMLWVSGSEGSRAFRHENGLRHPDLEPCESGAALMPWRLCPAAEPWASMFREALTKHVTENGVVGFKIDTNEVWCAAATHGHLPGIWSVYATTSALVDTLAVLRGLGAAFNMAYWGLRSPWWLLHAATLWEREYLVEAAAPSGQVSSALRAGVASSQDIGQQSAWNTIPTHLQDSLGVWISTTAWASWQGTADWDDAVMLDIARGGQLLQLWGDLRLLEEAGEVPRLAELWAIPARFADELGGDGSPVLAPAWQDAPAYGYKWLSPRGALVVVTAPTEAAAVTVSLDGWRSAKSPASVEIIYQSRRPGSAVRLAGGSITVDVPAGGVVAVFVGDAAGATHAGAVKRANPVVRAWSSIGSEDEAMSPDDPVQAPSLELMLLGRAPQIIPWIAGATETDKTVPEMALLAPPDDRTAVRRVDRYVGIVEVPTERSATVAVIVPFRRLGAAWHNDRLHALVSFRITVDGQEVAADVHPTRTHEQAGSWSSSVATFGLSSGTHDIAVLVETVAPADVDRDAVVVAR